MNLVSGKLVTGKLVTATIYTIIKNSPFGSDDGAKEWWLTPIPPIAVNFNI